MGFNLIKCVQSKDITEAWWCHSEFFPLKCFERQRLKRINKVRLVRQPFRMEHRHSVPPYTKIQAGKPARCFWSLRVRDGEFSRTYSSNEVVVLRSVHILSSYNSLAGFMHMDPPNHKGPRKCNHCVQSYHVPRKQAAGNIWQALLMISTLLLLLSFQVDLLQLWPHGKETSSQYNSKFLRKRILRKRPIGGPILRQL